MSSIHLTSSLPFTSWADIQDSLSGIQPAPMVLAIAKFAGQSAAQNDGTIAGTGHLNPSNLHVIQRLLLQRWKDSGWSAPDFEYDPADAIDKLSTVLRRINGLRDRHPAFISTSKPAARFQRLLWLTALEQEFSSRSSKHEIARTRLFNEKLWPEHPIAKAQANTSAFARMHYALILYLALWRYHGQTTDLAVLFRGTTLESHASTIREVFAHDANEFLVNHPVTTYPDRFRNPFVEQPVLRLPTGAVIAPDPTVLLTAMEHRTLMDALANGRATARQTAFDAASTAFGQVFETYVQQLLSWLETGVGGALTLEFKYSKNNNEVASPEAVVQGRFPLVFEAKALRFPFEQEEAWKIDSYVSWVEKLGGANNGRAAFEQGAAFFEDVQLGIVPGFPPGSLNDSLYIIVTYSEVPASLNWPTLRSELPLKLSEAARALFAKTVFLSVRDLEVAAAASTCVDGFSLANTLHAWQSWLSGQSVTPDRSFRGNFASYVLEQHPSVASAMAGPLHASFKAAFDEAADLAFEPNELDLGSVIDAASRR